MSIQVSGRYRSLPVVQPKRLDGVQIFQAFSEPQRVIELMHHDLTVHVGEVSHPRLHLRSVHQTDDEGLLRLVFVRLCALWQGPLTFYCRADGSISPEAGGGQIAKAVTIGYPEFPVEWVLQVATA